MKKNNFLVPVIFILCIILFFKAFLFNGLLPVPSDVLVGLFHPFRDSYAGGYPRGVPFKNFLLTDPVTQQIPWRDLSLKEMGSQSLPLWNPYQMAGYPLLGNIQSAPFYPLNVLFLFLPFSLAWSLLIVSQPLLAMIFMYFFLRQQKIGKEGSVLGAITFGFCGFMIAWLEWGTIGSTALWMPLILFALTKILFMEKKVWPSVLFVGSIMCAYLAGHTQTFFYEILLAIAFAFFLVAHKKTRMRRVIFIGLNFLLSILLLLPVIWIQFQFIGYSARMVDLNWQAAGWFIPWQNAVQFLVPNFFGNPATGNYWGIWNYGEFLGYVGIFPLILSIYALLSHKRKMIYFFGGVTAISLLFAFPTPLATLPFHLNIPFLSSAQPTRMLFLVDFSLAVLAAFGLDKILDKNKKMLSIAFSLLIFLAGLFWWVSSVSDNQVNWMIAQRNMILPLFFSSLTLAISMGVFFIPRYKKIASLLIIAITVVDLFLVSQKFTPFTKTEYFYPQVKTLSFLQKEAGINRVMSLDRRILHPNIATMYQIQMIEGYDPLYLLRFGELLAASNRNKPDISTPFGFSRILTTDRYQSPIIDLLGVKYVLSLFEINDPNLEKVFEEGQTKVYRNRQALPRVFFATSVKSVLTKEQAIDFLFIQKDLLKNTVVESDEKFDTSYSEGFVAVDEYTPNKITLKTANKDKGFLVLTDAYYPTWKASVDGKETSIYVTDFSFRGIIVPGGEHRVEFTNTPFSYED